MSCTAGNTGDVAAAVEIGSTADTVAEDHNCWPPQAVAVGSYSAHWMPEFPRDWRIETAAAVVRRRQWLGVAGVAIVDVAVVAAAGAD